MKSLFLALFLSLCISLEAGSTKFVGCLYTVDSDNIKLSWTAGERADSYEVQLFLIDKNSVYSTKTTNTNSITVKRPRSGHFKFRIRSKNIFGYSAWIESDDINAAKVDGQNMPWVIYWKLPAPVVIIE